MNAFQFAGDHPFLAFVLTWLIGFYVVALVNRIMRHWNIHKHGYPPAHCDADGDFPEGATDA